MKWNKEKLEECFFAYYAPLVKYVTLIIHNAHDAEDIVQNIFLKFPLIDRKAMKKSDYFKFYIFRCAKMEAYEYLRKRERKGEVFEEKIEETMDCSMEERFSSFRLDDLKEVLTKEEMEYVYLEFEEGFSAKEIGEILHMNPTKRKRFRKAVLEKVKEYLEKLRV